MRVLNAPFSRSSLLTVVVGLLLALYTWGVLRQAFVVNLDRCWTDQGAHLDIAREMERSDLAYVSPRVRMPLYMVLASTVIKASMPIETAFVIGKILNIALSFIVLAGVLVLFRTAIHPVFGGALAALSAFTVVGYRAGYVQCEMLYQFLFLLFFALVFELFRRPRYTTAVAAGVVGALGHLTKASVILGVYVTIACATLVLVYRLLPLPWRPEAGRQASTFRSELRFWSMPLVMFAAFFLTGAPYFLKSNELYGGFFYNITTAHNIWYESWDEVKEKTAGVADHRQLRTLRDYLADKTPQEIAGRMALGVGVFWEAFFRKYSVGSMLLVLAFAAMVLTATGRGRPAAGLGQLCGRFATREHFLAVALLGTYLAAYVFHAQVLPFPRFFIALALPGYYYLGLCAKELLGECPADGRERTAAGSRAWLWMTGVAVALMLYEIRFRWLPLTGREYFGQ